nr:protein NYNRIN-like [Tanacetum cinerariifolium]
MDDTVIKRKDKKMLLADIAETFNNLKKNNMKLNPKKCSFGVEEGKFLEFMVTSEGIRANPKKTKALVDLQSPRTLKEMKSLSEKLASLNRFLAKSAERSLPFFNTLKNITKQNKHEYRWTKEAEEAFQQMKKLIIDLSSLTLPWPKETLYVTVSAEAVSAVLLTDKKGRQCPVQYVSRTLNEAERNYAPMEKLAVSLIHMTRRNMNQKADVLSKLTSVAFNHLTKEVLIEVLNERSTEGQEWGMDIMGPLPPARGGAKFVIMAIDYFTKWIESKPVVKITGKEVIRFVLDNIICREEYNEEDMCLNLDLLQERRETPAIREARYKTKMEQYYNKKVRSSGFRPGEFMF